MVILWASSQAHNLETRSSGLLKGAIPVTVLVEAARSKRTLTLAVIEMPARDLIQSGLVRGYDLPLCTKRSKVTCTQFQNVHPYIDMTTYHSTKTKISVLQIVGLRFDPCLAIHPPPPPFLVRVCVWQASNSPASLLCSLHHLSAPNIPASPLCSLMTRNSPPLYAPTLQNIVQYATKQKRVGDNKGIKTACARPPSWPSHQEAGRSLVSQN